MVNEDFSCIKEVTKIVNLSLPSMYNTNENSGICDALESWKRQYVKQLQGIVVGYKNVSLTSKRGYLKADCPITFCNVKATFELFYPTIGSIIKGKINRISHDYIGCLVHDTINVTVHRTDDISSDISKFVALDKFILFQITRINFKSKFIHVKGKITEECITLMKESGLFSDNINELTYSSTDFSNSNNSHIVYTDPIVSNSKSDDMSTDTSSQSSPRKKKKKHKKSNDNFSESHAFISESIENDMDEIELTQPSDKSKKKKCKKADKNLTLFNSGLENEMEQMHQKNLTISEEHITSDLNNVGLDQSSNDIRKRKRKKSHVNLELPTNVSGDETELMHPKKKIKMEQITGTNDTMECLDNNISFMFSNIFDPQKTNSSKAASNSQNMDAEIDNCTVKSELLSPVKKKTHKKSKNNLEASSSFSDHAIETEIKSHPNVNSPKVLSSSHKNSEKDSLISLDIVDKSLNPAKSESGQVKEKPKKNKKKKERVSDKNKRHKKKKESASNKDKSRKKKKDKTKDSKKDKKKKVISTKKKIHGHSVKLKKKNRDKKSKNPKKSKNKKAKSA